MKTKNSCTLLFILFAFTSFLFAGCGFNPELFEGKWVGESDKDFQVLITRIEGDNFDVKIYQIGYYDDNGVMKPKDPELDYNLSGKFIYNGGKGKKLAATGYGSSTEFIWSDGKIYIPNYLAGIFLVREK